MVSICVTVMLLTWSWTSVIVMSFQDVQNDRFISAGVCGAGWEGQVMLKSGVRSRLECLARCGRTSGCEAAILVTSSAAGEKTCNLLAAQSFQCFASSSGQSSKLWKRSSIAPSSTESATASVQTTTAASSVCANGGTRNPTLSAVGGVGRTCTCLEGFAGEFCERRWKDCTEGQQLSSYTLQGHYFIQPVGAPSAFEVYCTGNWTRIHYRNQVTTSTCGPQDFFRNWTDYKSGFGRYPCDLWLGNEKLHQLTRQGRYIVEVQVLLKGDTTGKAYSLQYDGMVVENETQDYRLSLGNCTIDVYMKDGFGSSTPTSRTSMQGQRFGTYDHDILGCASATRSGWWFNTECSAVNLNVPEGNSPPGSKLLVWPIKTNQHDILQPAMLLSATVYY